MPMTNPYAPSDPNNAPEPPQRRWGVIVGSTVFGGVLAIRAIRGGVGDPIGWMAGYFAVLLVVNVVAHLIGHGTDV